MREMIASEEIGGTLNTPCCKKARTTRETIENEEAFLRGPLSFYSSFVECNFVLLLFLVAARDGVRRRSNAVHARM